MEELLLRSISLCDKLDIVDHEHVYISELCLKAVLALISYGIDKFADKGFRRNIDDVHVGIFGKQLISDCVHKVRLSKAHICRR